MILIKKVKIRQENLSVFNEAYHCANLSLTSINIINTNHDP